MKSAAQRLLTKARAGQGEGRLALKYCGVCLLGFATDALLLQIGVWRGLAPALARLISLACAMQVTFTINGLHVFHGLNRAKLPRQWASYMLTNGFGNFCNYWIFVSLVSLHWPVVSNRFFALGVGAFVAWMANYACTRFIVFGKAKAAPPL